MEKKLLPLILFVLACSTAPPPASVPAPVGEKSPWSANEPASGPAVMFTEWRNAENRETCAPMTFGDPGERVRGGTARRANFSGGWAVAWDVAGLPGREPSGAYCDSCGRGVYGLAGAGVVWGRDEQNAGFPHRIDWAGGEWAGYGLEGGQGPNWLAQVRVKDQSCVYYVWSFLGRDHLEHLLRQVRRARESG
jgi:hypothetical protein